VQGVSLLVVGATGIDGSDADTSDAATGLGGTSRGLLAHADVPVAVVRSGLTDRPVDRVRPGSIIPSAEALTVFVRHGDSRQIHANHSTPLRPTGISDDRP